MVDQSSTPTVKLPQVGSSVEEALKREILDPIMTAIHASAEETNALVERCISDQIAIRSDFESLRSEVEALKARGSAWDAASTGHTRSIAEGVAEARKLANDTRADVDATLRAAADRHAELAGAVSSVDGKCEKIGLELEAMRAGVGGMVLEALGQHVAAIEAAADKLTRTPQVRTAASIGGAFAGSALVTVIIEIVKHI